MNKAVNAKAGSRKVYGKGAKRKVKSFSDGTKRYCMPSMMKGEKDLTRTEMEAITARRLAPSPTKTAALEQVTKLQRNNGIGSDPFLYDRMRAHVRSGIFEF